jgi:hypothetical protein
VGLILVGVLIGWNSAAVGDNFGNLWQARGTVEIVPGLTALTAFGLFVAICVSQTGSLFSADAWNNITFTAGEVKEPRRNIPLSLALGTFIVIALYLLANVAYLVTLPFDQIQHAPGDRVAACLPNDVAICVAFLACMRLGALWVGINRVLAPREKTHILRVYLQRHADQSVFAVFLRVAEQIAQHATEALGIYRSSDRCLGHAQLYSLIARLEASGGPSGRTSPTSGVCAGTKGSQF